MRRDEALAELGLPTSAEARAVRRRFLELARERHPDRGGDPEAFAALHRAYAVLRAAPASPRPAVVRGRPSRAAPAPHPAPEPDDVGRMADDLVAALTDTERSAGPDRALRLVSVAPGARRNRAARALPEATLSVLVLRTRPGPAVALTVRTRAARRAVSGLALDDPALGAPWARRRGDAALEVRCELRQGDGGDPALAAATAAARLLMALAWPVADWTPEPRP